MRTTDQELRRFQAAAAADPIRGWIRSQVGLTPGAEEALGLYDQQFRTLWLSQELLHGLAALGARAMTVLEISGDAINGIASPPTLTPAIESATAQDGAVQMPLRMQPT